MEPVIKAVHYLPFLLTLQGINISHLSCKIVPVESGWMGVIVIIVWLKPQHHMDLAKQIQVFANNDHLIYCLKTQPSPSITPIC